MREALLALATGVMVGALFSFFKLPIPAPPALPGLAGIVGIYIGFKLINFLF